MNRERNTETRVDRNEADAVADEEPKRENGESGGKNETDCEVDRTSQKSMVVDVNKPQIFL